MLSAFRPSAPYHSVPVSTLQMLVCVQSDKVQFLRHIKQLPSKEVRTAEMILFSGQQLDAEGLLVQAGLIFRAIMLNLDLFNWDRYRLCCDSAGPENTGSTDRSTLVWKIPDPGVVVRDQIACGEKCSGGK